MRCRYSHSQGQMIYEPSDVGSDASPGSAENMRTRSVYRLQGPVTVLVEHPNGHRLQQLPAGSVVHISNGKPDRNGLIQGTCNGNSVQMFSRDLEDCAHSIGAAHAQGDDHSSGA